MKTLFLLLFIYTLHITTLTADNEPLQKSLILRSFPKKVVSYISKKPKLLHRRFNKKTYSSKLLKQKDGGNLRGYTVFPPHDKRKLIDIPNSPYFPIDANDEPKARVKKVLPDYNGALQRKKRAADPDPQPPPAASAVSSVAVIPAAPTFLSGPHVSASASASASASGSKAPLSAAIAPAAPAALAAAPPPVPAALVATTRKQNEKPVEKDKLDAPVADPAATSAPAATTIKPVAKPIQKLKKGHSGGKATNKTGRTGKKAKKRSNKKNSKKSRSRKNKKSRKAKARSLKNKEKDNKRNSDKKKKLSRTKSNASSRRYNNRRTVSSRRLIASGDGMIETYPYTVSIQKDGEHWCSGAILNQRLIITTANCLWKSSRMSRMRVRVCSRHTDRGGQVVRIQEVMKHPEWSVRKNPDCDIALFLVDKNIRFSDACHGLDLPNRVMMPPFYDAWITSWGADRRDGIFERRPMSMQVYHARLIDREKCNNATMRFGVAVTENFICFSQVGQRGPCTRDTGAPAVSDGVLWGLASWGLRKLCGTERFPAVFSYIASHRNMDFISNATTFLMSEDRPYPFLDRLSISDMQNVDIVTKAPEVV
ncbi:uncharacterized protein LOC113239769 [Hyposmocoma kahamanoa]|uniref:uncharacterized protein LOC113239769 n=1 Tax=Hyposmocoma kahamanoa TaxID=1477025 RepID=UPI000E6D92D6|nr:uncharacterized protein LOC113239769 [Hyposmocoma kahamanoa]